jgi:cell division protein FtsI/penicillin-binding protein 2
MSRNYSLKTYHALFIFAAIFLIAFARVGYLCLVMHEAYLEKSKSPRQISVHIEPDRGTIRDRMNRPMAVNKIAYDVGITFDKINLIPRAKNQNGQKVYPRKEYILKLAQFLAQTLQIESQEVEDLIFAKAALFPNTFFAVQQDISEEIFYHLKMAEKDWPGLDIRTRCKRYYPMGAVGLSLIGGVGPIQTTQIGQIHFEMDLLKSFFDKREKGEAVCLPFGFYSVQKAQERLDELKRLQYRLNSYTGRSGVEMQYDRYLRGIPGKERFEVDVKGRFLRKLPESTPPLPGARLLLSIDAALQEKAETLLIENEQQRDLQFPLQGKDHSRVMAPYIKGGAIVAIDPKSAEVLAMASYPRLHPDMDPKQWLESQDHILEIFDGIKPLQKERVKVKNKEFYFDPTWLTYDLYTQTILSQNCQVAKSLEKLNTVGKILFLQQAVATLLDHFQQTCVQTLLDGLYGPADTSIQFDVPADLQAEKLFLDPLFSKISHSKDRLLLYEICELIAPLQNYSEALIVAISEEPVEPFFALCQQIKKMEVEVKKTAQVFYKKHFCSIYRKKYFPFYLNQVRSSGGKLPYLDYLKPIEDRLFKTFYEKNRSKLISSGLIGAAVTTILDPCHAICEEIAKLAPSGQIQKQLQDFPAHLIENLVETIRSSKMLSQRQKQLACAFYPKHGFGFSRSFAYQESAPLGSIFKIVSGYAGLKKHLEQELDFTKPFDPNPLTIRDEGPRGDASDPKNILGFLLDGTPITRVFKGGRLPRSDHAIGKCDLERAIEQSSNIYFSLLADGAHEELLEACHLMGLGQRTGVDLPMEISGTLPFDLSYNKTGLYAFAIGQHLLTVTPLQVANLLASIVDEGNLKRPTVTKAILGAYTPKETNSDKFSVYFKPFGVDPDTFFDTKNRSVIPYILPFDTSLVRAYAFPKELSFPLLRGLHKVLNGERGGARPEAIRYYFQHPEKKRDYNKIRPYSIGKTATAQIGYRPFLDKEGETALVKHTWFALAHYDENYPVFEKPDFVVVVYLRYGDYGKEALPIAVEMTKTYLELQSTYKKNSK